MLMEHPGNTFYESHNPLGDQLFSVFRLLFKLMEMNTTRYQEKQTNHKIQN